MISREWGDNTLTEQGNHGTTINDGLFTVYRKEGNAFWITNSHYTLFAINFYSLLGYPPHGHSEALHNSAFSPHTQVKKSLHPKGAGMRS